RFSVRPEPGYFEPLAWWSAAAMEPGNRKTANFRRFVAPLIEWEQLKGAEIEPKIKQAESEQKTTRARIDKLRQKAAGTANPADYQNLANEIQELEINLPEIPTRPRKIADDIT